jgi:mannose-6-phosphate isomerase-like protein (cupin superfamily)
MDEPIRGGVFDGAGAEIARYPTDVIRMLVVDRGPIQVFEYESVDRDGPTPHTHPWDEVEYVIDGTVEFLVGDEWTTVGAGGVQLLPAGTCHSVRVPAGTAKVLMVTIGAPADGFVRDVAAISASGAPATADVVAVAARHGVRPAP